MLINNMLIQKILSNYQYTILKFNLKTFDNSFVGNEYNKQIKSIYRRDIIHEKNIF